MQARIHVDAHTNPEELALALAARGAILTIGGANPQPFLVGDLTWLDARRVFWFVAHGDTPDDGRVLEFDELQVVNRDRIAFVRDRTVLAYLTSIDDAQVDDPDDYRVAWGIWQQVQPARADMIARLQSRHLYSRTR